MCSSFGNLVITAEHMILLVLAKSHFSCGLDDKLDNFIKRKEQGLIELLWYEIPFLALSCELMFSQQPHWRGQDIESGRVV